MTHPLKTTPTEFASGVAFGAFAPTALALIVLAPLSLIPGYDFLFGDALAISIGGPIAMVLIGLPLWGGMHLLRVDWRNAGEVDPSIARRRWGLKGSNDGGLQPPPSRR